MMHLQNIRSWLSNLDSRYIDHDSACEVKTNLTQMMKYYDYYAQLGSFYRILNFIHLNTRNRNIYEN